MNEFEADPYADLEAYLLESDDGGAEVVREQQEAGVPVWGYDDVPASLSGLPFLIRAYSGSVCEIRRLHRVREVQVSKPRRETCTSWTPNTRARNQCIPRRKRSRF